MNGRIFSKTTKGNKVFAKEKKSFSVWQKEGPNEME